MFERMLNKDEVPTPEEISDTVSADGMRLLDVLEGFLNNAYRLNRELKFPFGNDYGWGYKYSHLKKHLCYVFFEKGAFTVTVQIGKNELTGLYKIFDALLPKTKELWENRYPCGDGGWLHYRILNENELSDVIKLIGLKKKPAQAMA